jgi:hypothetical protein
MCLLASFMSVCPCIVLGTQDPLKGLYEILRLEVCYSLNTFSLQLQSGNSSRQFIGVFFVHLKRNSSNICQSNTDVKQMYVIKI